MRCWTDRGKPRRPGRKPPGRGLHQSDRSLALFRGDGQPPGRKRHGRLPGADRESLETQATRVLQPLDGRLGGRGHGLALQEKIWAREPSSRTKSPPASSARSAQSPETLPLSSGQEIAGVISPRNTQPFAASRSRVARTVVAGQRSIGGNGSGGRDRSRRRRWRSWGCRPRRWSLRRDGRRFFRRRRGLVDRPLPRAIVGLGRPGSEAHPLRRA